MSRRTPTLQVFQQLIRARGGRLSGERTCIVKEVLGLRHGFSADELCNHIRKKKLGISRDTVYRTLPLLLESGIIQKSVGNGKAEYFEATQRIKHHDHAICVQCGDVIEFRSSDIERLQLKICGRLGFQLVFHDHRLFGRCRKCRERGQEMCERG